MRKFIVKMSAFLLIGLMALFGLNNLYTNTNYFKSLNSVSKFFNVPDGIEIANLGSSHGQASFYYDNLDIKGFNFALGSQGLYYDSKILEQYADKIKPNSVVIIPISYFSFYSGTEGELFKGLNPRYYQFLKPWYIYNFSVAEYIRYRLLPVLSAGPNLKYIIKGISPKKQGASHKQDDGTSLTEQGIRRAEYHLARIKEGKSLGSNTLKDLEHIIDFCYQKKFTPVLITTPFTKYYNNGFPDSFYEDFYSKIDYIKGKYNVTYLDYSHDARFAENMELYENVDHLNVNGAKLFTQIVLDDLKNRVVQ